MALPSEKDVRDLLANLLGRDVDVQPGEPVRSAPVDLFTVAVYATDTLKAVSLIACDLPLSAFLGCALALLPVAGAREAVEQRALGEEMAENLHEIFNVGATMFNGAETPHVKLYHVYQPGEQLPIDVRHWLNRPGGRLDLATDVPGYGGGRLSVVDTWQ